jgi:hypothetical protein
MENAIKVIDEQIEDNCGEVENFKVDDDNKAEWIMAKIVSEKAESQRMINICNSMILMYQNKIQKEQERLNNKLTHYEGKLRQYFEIVEKKITKTQESYRLPSGTLKKKYKLHIEKNEEKLKEYLEKNNPDYIEKITTEKVKWGDYKKTLKFQDGKAITVDGEILDCITATEENEFIVEV